MEETIKEIIETIENTLFMATWPTSSCIWANIHLESCITTLKEIKKGLEKSIK